MDIKGNNLTLEHQVIPPWQEPMRKCDCGHGEGFYHDSDDGMHEYNPFVTQDQATSKYHKDRKPLALFYGHIDGRKVRLVVNSFPGAQLSKDQTVYDFSYAKYGGRESALSAASAKLVADTKQLKLI